MGFVVTREFDAVDLGAQSVGVPAGQRAIGQAAARKAEQIVSGLVGVDLLTSQTRLLEHFGSGLDRK